MARRVEKGGLLEQLISCARPVVLLYGPAGSGKTRLCLSLYDHYQQTGPGRCILLAPNAPSAAAMRRRLLTAQDSGVLVAPGVMTFATLASRILAARHDTGDLLSGPQRLAMLRHIIDELASAGKLAALGPVADTPGVVGAVDRSIAELKRAAIEPDTLAKAVSAGSTKHRDLLEIYRRYQQHLHQGGAYDLEGQMWQALVHLSTGDGGELPGLAGVSAVLADGFTDFTPTQLQMLHRIGSANARVLITLPLGDDNRSRMWHWTGRTRERIADAFGGDLEEIVLPERSGGVLGPVAAALFDIDASPATAPKHLSLCAAAGTDSEVGAAAQQIKRLLLQGAPAGSIALLARNLDAYRPTIERIFAECDIPIAHAPQPLTQQPIVRFLMDVAGLLPEAEYPAVCRVLKSSYFQPRALGDFDEAVVATAAMVIREGNVLEGTEAYTQAAKRLAQRRPWTDAEADDEQAVPLGPLAVCPDRIRQAGELFERLFETAAMAIGPGGHIEPAGLAALIDALFLREAATAIEPDDLAARDLRALGQLQPTLDEIDTPVASMARLRELLSAATSPAPRTESLVEVLDVLDARALRFDHVFLLGLGEGQFPARTTDSALISESDRATWASRGLVLDSRDDLTAREMLLFYLAVTRADESLAVSYQHTTSSGGAAAPGAFLTSLLDGLVNTDLADLETRLPPGRFLPAAKNLASPHDTLNAAVGGLFNSPGPSKPAMAWTARCAAPTLARVTRGMWAAHRRWQTGPCNEFDGRLGDPRLLAHLAGAFGSDHPFSARAFNTFGQCPWRFFADYVLGLTPLSPPQRRLEPVHEGLFCHRVLFRVLSALAGPGHRVHLASLDGKDIQKALAQAVATEVAETDALSVPYPALWAIQHRRMQQSLSRYLQAAADNDVLSAESLSFELAFGLADQLDEQADSDSRAGAVEIETPGGKVLVHGRIDRVDRVTFEGTSGLMAIDYKTGSIPRTDAIRGGQNLQLPVYIAVLEQLFDEPCLGGAFHRVTAQDARYDHFFATVGRRGDRYSLFAAYDDALHDALTKIDQYVQSIRTGHFDLMPAHSCRDCDYRRICHFSEARMELKSPGEGNAP